MGEEKEGIGSAPPDESLPCAAKVPSILMVQQLNIASDKVKRHLPVGSWQVRIECRRQPHAPLWIGGIARFGLGHHHLRLILDRVQAGAATTDRLNTIAN